MERGLAAARPAVGRYQFNSIDRNSAVHFHLVLIDGPIWFQSVSGSLVPNGPDPLIESVNLTVDRSVSQWRGR